MEMKIDEIIEELERTKDYPLNDPASDEALDGAIDTMRKYQKIEEIIENWRDGTLEHDSIYAIYQIARVVEDENDD